MKLGINMLLWTGHVTQEHVPVLQALKAAGYDGVEVPVFDVSDAGHYRWLGGVLDDLGLERTVVAIIPDAAHSPISPDAAHRQAGVDHLKRVIDCSAVLGGTVLAGPWFQPLGALYNRACLPVIQQAIEAGDYSLQRLLLEVRTNLVSSRELAAADPEGMSFRDADTPRALRQLQEHERSRHPRAKGTPAFS